MKLFWYLSALSFILFSCKSSQSSIGQVPEEDYSSFLSEPDTVINGACFSKFQVDAPDIDFDNAPVCDHYDVSSDLDVVIREQILEVIGTEWVKKKSPNCESKVKDDCMILCLVEIPGKIKESVILLDTTLQDVDYHIEAFASDDKVRYSIWREVVCSSTLTTDFIIEMQNALKAKGLYNGSISGVLDNPTIKGLMKVQQQNGLPSDALLAETFKYLGLD